MIRIVLILYGLAISTLTLAQEPTNLSALKSELKQYHDSGEYAKDINSVVARAQSYLQDRINSNKQLQSPKKLAIVLDIDETSLSNYPLMTEYDFSGSMTNGVPAQLSYTNASSIEPTLQLVQLAQQNQVAVFFITGRTKDLAQSTIENLTKAGYDNWNQVYFQPKNLNQASISVFKTAMRKKISQNGFDIVINMGDQCSDLKGGYAEQTYKLPDPFYFVP